MDLIARLRDLRSREHLCTVDLIEALVECDRTRAYLEHGYSSLWNFLVDGLQYSNAGASRRCKATRCARKFPAVLAALRAQRVTLSSLEAIEPLLAEIQDEAAFFDRIAGKSFVQVKESVAKDRPEEKKRDSVRRHFVKQKAVPEAALFDAGGAADADADHVPVPVVEERVTVTLSLTPEEFALIERARAIASRKPGRVPSVREAIVETARFYVRKRGPKERSKERPKERAAAKRPTASTRTRHIPIAIRDEVLLRDGERCTFVAPDGRRCPATHDLHLDHVDPFAFGGAHTPENLRVLCGAHNRRRGEKTFGWWPDAGRGRPSSPA